MRRLLLYLGMLSLALGTFSCTKTTRCVPSHSTQDNGGDDGGGDALNDGDGGAWNSDAYNDGYGGDGADGGMGDDGGGTGGDDGQGSLDEDTPARGTAINVGGVQDIGAFRAMVEAGEIPPADFLDPNGFFSEHHLDLPPADCGHSVCLYSMLAKGQEVVSDSQMALLAVVMVSPIDPAEVVRPPMDFVLVLDVSGSMAGPKVEAMKEGLRRMLQVLDDRDRVALITYNEEVQTLAELTPLGDGGREELMALVDTIYANGMTNIYDALQAGFSVIESRDATDATRPARLVLLSDGRPTVGVGDTDEIVSMAVRHMGPGINLTTIGVGYDINFELMKELAMEGGNFYFVEDDPALEDIFVQEANYFPMPIASDARLTFHKGENGYTVAYAVGFPGWRWTSDGGECSFESLYLATRKSENSELGDHGRRGGGSVLFLKLKISEPGTTLVGFHSSLSYIDLVDSTEVEISYEYSQYFGEETLPVENEYYSDAMALKAVAMYNAYHAIREAVRKAVSSDGERADPNGAIRLLNSAMIYTRTASLRLRRLGAADADGDDDLEADGRLMARLAANIKYACGWSCYEQPMTWNQVRSQVELPEDEPGSGEGEGTADTTDSTDATGDCPPEGCGSDDDPSYGDEPSGDEPSGDGPSGDEPSGGDDPSYGDEPSGNDPYGSGPDTNRPAEDQEGQQDTVTRCDGYVEVSYGCSVGSTSSPSVPLVLLTILALLVTRRRSHDG